LREVDREAVLPHARVRSAVRVDGGRQRAVNAPLRLAGDGVGRSNLESCRTFAPLTENKFFATVLSRENQQEFACCRVNSATCTASAAGGSQCALFGRRDDADAAGAGGPERHSATFRCGVLEQLVYKWRHFREILARVLADKYADLARTGWSRRRGNPRVTPETFWAAHSSGFARCERTRIVVRRTD